MGTKNAQKERGFRFQLPLFSFRINAFIRKCTDFHKQILTINLKSITMKNTNI